MHHSCVESKTAQSLQDPPGLTHAEAETAWKQFLRAEPDLDRSAVATRWLDIMKLIEHPTLKQQSRAENARQWLELQERWKHSTLEDKLLDIWAAASLGSTTPSTVVDRLVELHLDHNLTFKNSVKAVFPCLAR
jgi:hypothetical protein